MSNTIEYESKESEVPSCENCRYWYDKGCEEAEVSKEREDELYQEGYDEGFNTAIKEKCEDCYDRGYTDGIEGCYEHMYNKVYTDIYNQVYEEGYNKGYEEWKRYEDEKKNMLNTFKRNNSWSYGDRPSTTRSRLSRYGSMCMSANKIKNLPS